MIILRYLIVFLDQLLRLVIDLCVVFGTMGQLCIAKFSAVVLPKNLLEMVYQLLIEDCEWGRGAIRHVEYYYQQRYIVGASLKVYIISIKNHNKIEMTAKQHLRMSILSQSDLLASKRRFGLFNQPLSTAIGDDGPYLTKIHTRNQMGKPVTQPRNIVVSPLKSGMVKSSYFGSLNSLADHTKKDIFLEQGIRLLKQRHQTFQKGRKQTNFYPIAGIKPISNLSYEYIQQKMPQLDPKRYKQEDGKVRCGPRNFYSNPQSKVIDTTFKHYKYIEDQYDRKHKMEVQYRKKQRAKEFQASFAPNSFYPKTFASNKEIYGLDREIINKSQQIQKKQMVNPQNPWSPASFSKQGRNGLFEPVPKYLQNPPAIKSRPLKNDKQAFKSMGSVSSIPSPSVSLNRVNLMKSFSRATSPKR